MEMTRTEALEILKDNKIEIDIKDSRSPEELAKCMILLGNTAIGRTITQKIDNKLDSDTNQ